MFEDIKVECVDKMGNDLTVVNAARVSMDKFHYKLEPNDENLIRYLAENNHWSPFAHAMLQVRIKAPIFVARQLVKHQVGLVWNECFSDDTEVLTNSGWKLWCSVTKDDLLATPELDGSSYSFKKPLELIKNKYIGNMVHIHSRDLDMLVTPNHDQYISYYRNGGWTEYQKMPTHEAVDKKFAKTMKMPTINYPEGDDYWEGKLYGAFLGDGSLSKDEARIYFHVKKDKKKRMLRELAEQTPEFDWNESEQEDGYSYFRIRNIAGWCGHVDTKAIDFYKRTRSFLRGVYDGLIATDGHVTDKNSVSFSTVSKNMVVSLGELAYLLGFDTRIHVRGQVGNWNEAYKYSFKCAKPKLLKNYKEVSYSGYVYCAKTETGLLIVRRNGKSCVSGNCSRRYVDSEPTFYLPELRERAENVKQGSRDVLIELGYNPIKEASETALKAYKQLLEANVAPEVARSVLPLNTMTEWIWTGSLYAFVRVVKLRTDSHAQKEARIVAERIKDILKAQFPLSYKYLIGIYEENESFLDYINKQLKD